jgi:uroporphyrin-III C-methyltransferase/precorrin-2 dehydrogenase/sirohydrochlorin ferrochelatase
MQYFPVFFDLRGQNVLVVGGGTVAERKIRSLLSAGAVVHVAAQNLNRKLQTLLRENTIRRIAQTYDESQLTDKRLVFAATDDIELNHRVYRDAERCGVPVNVVDDKAHCRFISPALVDRSPVLVAICTGGTSPVLARRIRRWIEQLLPRGLGKVAHTVGQLRDEVKRKLKPEQAKRFWEARLSDANLQRLSGKSPESIRAEIKSMLKQGKAPNRGGMVYLVGAGPGNPDLLTLRALDVLGCADVVLYDRLVSREVLGLVRRDAERIYVGKEAGNHHVRQEEIHRIMLEQAALGRTVVRLKGGDAFIFGRGGEELEVLREANVAYEVVPGITAATACAAYAGIPLTHREHAQSLTFLTGHLATGTNGTPVQIDWASFTGEGKTTAVYMGVKQAGEIQAGLLAAGIKADLPVALIENGSRDDQRIIGGTVGSIPALARQVRNGSPGLLIIGHVAALAETLGWFRGVQNVRKAA